jgi:RNA polymerase sigma factor (sigma-70 family)
MTSNLYESEAPLIRACAEGDPEAWVRFRAQYGRLIRATASKFCGFNEESVADLEAITYQKLLEDRCRRLHAWQGRSRFSTYLVQVVRNLALDWLDKERRTLQGSSIEDSPEIAAENDTYEETEYHDVQVQALKQAITRLPERQAIIIRLRLEGKSLRDIALTLKRPVGTVSVENSRALTRLRTYMEEAGVA